MSCIKVLTISAIFIFLLTSCEEFTGYRYDVEQVNNTAEIKGTVNNTFTNLPVYKALIQIAEQHAFTDAGGQFLIQYVLGEDESRDKPLPITISAENYFPYYSEIILYPSGNNLNISLEYAAPIIHNTAFVRYEEEIYVCQAIISDYQGISDITSVVARFYYRNQNDNTTKNVTQTMDVRQIVSTDTAYFQSIAEVLIQNGFRLELIYDVIATDKEGYKKEVSALTTSVAPDKFIFDPGF